MKAAPGPNDRIVAILDQAFRRVKKQNRSVSLRALARHAGVTSSYLSKIFRSERRLTPRLLGRLAKSLQLDHHEVAEVQRLLLQEVESRSLSPSTGIRTIRAKELRLVEDYAAYGKPDFWLLEEWYLLPLLNLVNTESFSPDPARIAARLGIESGEAERALERLIDAGYLRIDPAGKLGISDRRLRFPTQRSHESVRKYHKAMIGRTLPLLEAPPADSDFAERLISGITLAGDPRFIPEAKVVIEEALYKAAEILAAGAAKEVFQINLQLFKLSR